MTNGPIAFPQAATTPAQGLVNLVEALAPIIGVSVRLRFSREAYPGLLHEPALTGMVRTLMDGQLADEPLLWVQSTESGRIDYAVGEEYSFNVFAARPAHAVLNNLIARLPRLASYVRTEHKVPFGSELTFQGLYHPVTGEAIRHAEPASVFDQHQFVAVRQRFSPGRKLRVRLLSPLRVLRDKAERGSAKGEARYVHDSHQLVGIFTRRVFDSLLAIAKQVGVWLPRPADEPQVTACDLFQIDWVYRDENRHEKSLAGLLGWLELDLSEHDPSWLDALLIAQHMGIGQRRAFGWGALRLESVQGQGVLPPRRPLVGLGARAASQLNLRLALVDSLPAGDAPWGLSFKRPDDHLHQPATELLDELAHSLKNGNYQPPPLQGRIITPADGRVRPLAVPPWRDRVAQRALSRLVTAALETIFNPESFGYRRGRSRFNVRDRLGQLYREGYCYYFEADIHGFFDHVEWSRLDTRLRALFGDDPAIDLILRWMAAPVNYMGHEIIRQRGLPQGSPLSPVLSNLLLEDFDADCVTHGFKLLRFADDFVILCKSKEQAMAAWKRAEISIGEIGLKLKESKTGVGMLDQGPGLQFLGFQFLGDLVTPKPRSPLPPGQAPQIPENSWLAELLRQKPHLRLAIDKQLANRRTSNKPAVLFEEDLGEVDCGEELNPESTFNSTPVLEVDNAIVPAAAADQGTLLCVTENALLAQNRGRLKIITERDGGMDFAWSDLEAVLLFGNCRLTSGAINAALEHDVVFHFMERDGQYRGRLISEQRNVDNLDHVFTQKECFGNPLVAGRLASRLVQARIYNQRETLRQRLRRSGEDQPVLQQLNHLFKETEGIENLSSLNGYEGRASRLYYETMAEVLPDWVNFQSRNRRPPRDAFNALLSLGYTIIYSRTLGLIHLAGLHPLIGFYHQPHGRHAVLASDLMEPFRHLVERTACTVLNRRELSPEDFVTNPEQGCRLSKPALRRYLIRISEAMSRRMTTVDNHQGDFYQLMQRQLSSLKIFCQTSELTLPWFFRTR